MKPAFAEGHVRADCPDCGAPTTFEFSHSGSEFGSVIVNKAVQHEGRQYSRLIYKLLRCSVCQRAGVAKVAANNSYTIESALIWFWPTSCPVAKLPTDVPEGVLKEYREAEICMSVEAWRGAAALLRSALEKTLSSNGYNEKDLYQRIEAAGTDGVITSARRQRAHDLVRTLANDVLHDEWRVVTQDEAEDAHHYVGRVIEDLYDDRAAVEKVLVANGRIKKP
jgi:hypothetical protein